MNNLELVKTNLGNYIRIQSIYKTIFELSGRAYCGLKNYVDKYECYSIKNFESFTTDMTQGQFYSIWKLFSSLKIKDLFFSNKADHEGRAIEITMPSFLFHQLNTVSWFALTKDSETSFERITKADEAIIPEIIKTWIYTSDENKLIWDLMHYDLTKKEDFQKLLRFRCNQTLNPELFSLLENEYEL